MNLHLLAITFLRVFTEWKGVGSVLKAGAKQGDWGKAETHDTFFRFNVLVNSAEGCTQGKRATGDSPGGTSGLH